MSVRIAQIGGMSKKTEAAIRIGSIFAALIVTSIFILFIKLNPIKVYTTMIEGCFGSTYRTQETIVKAIPLLLIGLGIAIAFKMKFWNIGGEGQMAMGAIGATFVALQFPDMSKPLLLLLMALAGIVAGGLWAFLAAVLKVKFGTNETIVTLMLNYIALKIITYLQYGPWKDPSSLGFPKIASFSENATLPTIFGVHIGWIISVILVVAIYLFMNHTKKGFEIQMIGESENTARYAGINVGKTILLALFISGAISGLAGMLQVSGVDGTLSTQTTGGAGFTAIIVIWLSNLNAVLALVVSVLFAVLIQGASYIQTVYQIPASAAQIIEGIILCFVLAGEFFTKYKVIFDIKKSGSDEDYSKASAKEGE